MYIIKFFNSCYKTPQFLRRKIKSDVQICISIYWFDLFQKLSGEILTFVTFKEACKRNIIV